MRTMERTASQWTDIYGAWYNYMWESMQKNHVRFMFLGLIFIRLQPIDRDTCVSVHIFILYVTLEHSISTLA